MSGTTDKLTILAVDDDKNNLRILSLDLEDGYNILTAEDGEKGLEVLKQHGQEIKVILLDRMMPRMDGMQFIREVKQLPEFSDIPIIMQTAAAEKDQIAEGIRAGVYYYLTKPYQKEILLSVVDAAARDYTQYSKLRQDLRQFTSRLKLVRNACFEIRTLEDVKYLATFLSQFFPQPDRVIFGLSELLVNAVEHGNLGIGYEEKSRLNNAGIWQEEVERRLNLPENLDKKVVVDYENQGKCIRLTIRDQGEGFDWEEFMEISPVRATHNHGRGIALSRMTSFDTLEYGNGGNIAICTVQIKH